VRRSDLEFTPLGAQYEKEKEIASGTGAIGEIQTD
jgi:hypothetical protein